MGRSPGKQSAGHKEHYRQREPQETAQVGERSQHIQGTERGQSGWSVGSRERQVRGDPEKQVGPDSMSGSYDTCERKLSETLSAMCVFGDRNMSRDHSEALAVILERSDRAGTGW